MKRPGKEATHAPHPESAWRLTATTAEARDAVMSACLFRRKISAEPTRVDCELCLRWLSRNCGYANWLRTRGYSYASEAR